MIAAFNPVYFFIGYAIGTPLGAILAIFLIGRWESRPYRKPKNPVMFNEPCGPGSEAGKTSKQLD